MEKETLSMKRPYLTCVIHALFISCLSAGKSYCFFGSIKDTVTSMKDQAKDQLKAEMEAKRTAMEAKYDSDGDGTLSDTEKQAMHEARKTEMQSQMLKKFDTDGDGILSDTEKSAMESARPQKGERGMGKGMGKGGPRPGMKNRR